MTKIQSLLLLFFINVCFSQHIHENIQWDNSTEPVNENKNSIIGVFNNFYVDYEKEIKDKNKSAVIKVLN